MILRINRRKILPPAQVTLQRLRIWLEAKLSAFKSRIDQQLYIAALIKLHECSKANPFSGDYQIKAYLNHGP